VKHGFTRCPRRIRVRVDLRRDPKGDWSPETANCEWLDGATTAAELEARLADLPGEIEVVAYCRGANCVLAHDAVRLLTARGRRGRRLADGMLEWRLEKLPVEAEAR
jgi:rhodanese-related sulfurtransferase